MIVYSYFVRNIKKELNPSQAEAKFQIFKLFGATLRHFLCYMSSLTHMNLWNSTTGSYLRKRRTTTDIITLTLGRKPLAKHHPE